MTAVEYLIDRRATQQYEEDLENYPARPEEALAAWIRNLLASLGTGVANDVCDAAILELCGRVCAAGSLAQTSITRCVWS